MEGAEGAAQLHLVLGVAVQSSEFMDVMRELALVPALTGAILVEAA